MMRPSDVAPHLVFTPYGVLYLLKMKKWMDGERGTDTIWRGNIGRNNVLLISCFKYTQHHGNTMRRMRSTPAP